MPYLPISTDRFISRSKWSDACEDNLIDLDETLHNLFGKTCNVLKHYVWITIVIDIPFKYSMIPSWEDVLLAMIFVYHTRLKCSVLILISPVGMIS